MPVEISVVSKDLCCGRRVCAMGSEQIALFYVPESEK